MSQEISLKTSIAVSAPKVDNGGVENQALKAEDVDGQSFSSKLDEKMESYESQKSEQTTMQNKEGDLEKEAEHTLPLDNDKSGNSLPEDVSLQAETSASNQQIIEIADEADVTVSLDNKDKKIVSVDIESIILPEEVTQEEPEEQNIIIGQQTTPIAAEVVTAKVMIGKAEGAKLQEQTQNKSKPVSSMLNLAASEAEHGKSAENSDDLDLGVKQQTTALRSDIFHALSKNKSQEEGVVLKDAKSMLMGQVTERADKASTSFATTLAATSSLAAATGAQSTSAVAQPVLAVQPAIYSEAWNRVMSSRVVWMAREGVQEASLKLNPANLGSVEVKVSMHNDQANVSFIAQNSATRDALEQALPRLKESFEENGLQLADADVSEQESEQTDDKEMADDASSIKNMADVEQAELENKQQREGLEQELELGLSLYA